MQIELSNQEVEALKWALARLKSCKQDSEKAYDITFANPFSEGLKRIAISNINNYEYLQAIYNKCFEVTVS